MAIRTLDLFCGGGGSSWGAHAAGAEIKYGVDAWDLAVATYQANFISARVVEKRLTSSSRPSELGQIGSIDLLLASPECTNHTCARGSRPRDEASKQTAHYVLNFATDLRPRWIVIENVVSMRRWQGYAPLIEELERLGYKIRVQVLDAADFGVPQRRRRLFLICDRKALPAAVESRTRKVRTVSDILDASGTWVSRPLDNGRRAPDTLARAERAIHALGSKRPFLIVYYGTDGSGGWQPLDRPIRTLTTLDRFGLVTWEGRTPMLRMLQVPELMRAMGFDSQYKLRAGTRRDKIKLLGNGVCPPVMKAVVSSLAR
jgi:DNA (cytosine-5)-methyltransferase 1